MQYIYNKNFKINYLEDILKKLRLKAVFYKYYFTQLALNRGQVYMNLELIAYTEIIRMGGNIMTENWENKKKKWMESIEQFYNEIETWMKSIPDLKIIHEAIELEEKNKGCFNIERMIIKAGKKNAVLKPVETVIMGVHASLELQGDNGIVKFVLVPEDYKIPNLFDNTRFENKKDSDAEKLIWKIVTSSPLVKFIDMNKEVFTESLMRIL